MSADARARLLALVHDAFVDGWNAAGYMDSALTAEQCWEASQSRAELMHLAALLPPEGQPVNLTAWALRTAAIITEVAEGHRYEQRIEAILLDAVKELAPVGQEAPQ